MIGDVNARRGKVTSVDRRATRAFCPRRSPKEMFGYVTALRSLSRGENYTMKFSHYDKG